MEEPTSGIANEYKELLPIVQEEVIREEAWSIGGWLGFFALGLCFLPLRLVINAYKAVASCFSAETITIFQSVTLDDLSYLPISILILWEALVNLTFIALAFVLIYIFFQRKRYFPKAFAFFAISNIVIIIADNIAATSLTGNNVEFVTTGMVRQIISTAIWVPYMFTSERAKHTFVL